MLGFGPDLFVGTCGFFCDLSFGSLGAGRFATKLRCLNLKGPFHVQWRKAANSKYTRPQGEAVDKADVGSVSIADFQRLIHEMYFEKDVARGADGTFLWLMEEIGELAAAVRTRDRENLEEEFADVLAWLFTIANVIELDLTAAIQKKYGDGCPGCHKYVCICEDAGKP